MRQKAELRGYQNRLVTRLYESTGHVAVLPMGGGKTISTLTAVQELIEHKEIRHALIVAPKRVASLVWPEEIMGWAHTCGLRYGVLTGSPVQREVLLAGAGLRDITICGIDNLQWLLDQIVDWPDDHPIFDLLVIDEISRMRNPRSKRAKALKRQMNRFGTIWGLTGTPRPNGYEDLFNPLTIVSHGTIWGSSFDKWRRQHFYSPDYNGHKWEVLPTFDKKLLAEADPWMTTIADADMPELPELSIIPHYIDLPPDARRMYRTMERALFADLPPDPERWTPDQVIAVNRAVATGKLAQLAQGFIYNGGGDGGAVVAERIHDEKIEWLTETVEDFNGQPALVVYEFREDLARLQEVFGDGLPYLGAGIGDAAAARHVRAWNAGELPVLALHPASAGHGLNLQAGGNQMIWLGPIWSAELWEQTLKRIHRPGQSSRCFAHVCLARGTVDEVKRGRVVDKLTSAEAFRRYLKTI